MEASKQILKRNLALKDGNPDHAWQNLVWAPNYGGQNHTPGYAAYVRYELQAAAATRSDTVILETLKRIGEEFNLGHKSFAVGPWTDPNNNWRKEK